MTSDTEAIREAYREELEEKSAEIAFIREELERLKYAEALKNSLEVEVAELQRALNQERVKNASLRDALEGMVEDMSQMEVQIDQLSGRL